MPARRSVKDAVVVVPFADDLPALARQLGALAGQYEGDRFEVVVAVNRADGLEPVRQLIAGMSGVRLVDASAVAGAAAARNAGWRASSAPLVLFCDADDEVAPGWSAAVRRALGTSELVRGALDMQSLNRIPFPLNRRPDRHPTKFHHLPFGPTCSLGVRRSLLEALDGFDEQLAAGEDIDLCWRAQYRGAELAYAADAVVKYRLRQRPGEVYRQGVRYGEADAPLYRRHRSQGARYDARDVARDIAAVTALTALGVRSAGDRLKLAHETGVLVGRLRGRVAAVNAEEQHAARSAARADAAASTLPRWTPPVPTPRGGLDAAPAEPAALRPDDRESWRAAHHSRRAAPRAAIPDPGTPALVPPGRPAPARSTPARPASTAPGPEPGSPGMEFADYAAVLRRNLLLLVTGAVLGALAGLVLGIVQPPVYQSTTRMLVTAESDGTLASIAAGNTLAQQVVATYADLAVSPWALQPVSSELGVPGGVAALTPHVEADAATGSTVLEIQVKDSDPQRAARIANAIASRLDDAGATIAPIGTGSVPLQVTVIQAATPGTAPVGPKPSLDVLVGLLVGLVVAAAVALLRQGAVGRIQSVGMLRRATDLPLLAAIGRDRAAAARFHDAVGAATPWGESFRSLRASLDFADFSRPSGDGRALVVTSAGAGEGRTTTAANLAAALAEAGESVVLLDCDLRSPHVAVLLGLGGNAGLTEVLEGSVPLESAIRTVGERGLAVLPAGRRIANPSELLRSEPMAELLGRLRAAYAWVVVDTPPLGVVSDAALVARRAAGVVLVTRIGGVTRAALQRTVEQLDQVGADVLGVVANDTRSRRPDRSTAPPPPTRTGRRARLVPLPARTAEQ